MFRDALESELAGERAGWLYGWRYLYSGKYCRQIARYVREFGDDRVLLINFDDLRSNPIPVCTRIFRHLGLRCDVKIRTDFVANKTLIPPALLWDRVAGALNYNCRLKDIAKGAISEKLRHRLRDTAFGLVSRFGHRPRPLGGADRRFLVDYYDAEITKLQRITSWNIDDWRGLEGV